MTIFSGGTVDLALASLLMLAIVSAQVAALIMSVFVNTELSAFSLVKLSNDLIGLVLGLLVFFLWHTFCFQDSRMRDVLKKKSRILPNGMLPGGFLPIPAAASVGLLLFVTGTFVNTGYVEGSLLVPGPFCVWLPGKRCRANAVEDADYLTHWFGRFNRGAPTAPPSALMKTLLGFEVQKGALEGSCFTGAMGGKGVASDFEKSAVLNESVTCPATNITCSVYSCPTSANASNGPVGSPIEDGNCIPNLIVPLGEKDRKCMYQCVGWNSLSIRAILENSGSISVGAAIVVWLTSTVSAMAGPPFVTADTEPQQLADLYDKHGPERWIAKILKAFSGSYCTTAFPIVAIYLFFKLFLVCRIDADGFFTVDYYVTFVLLFAAVQTVLLKYVHPFEGSTVLFTEKLWKEGSDEFIMNKDHAKNLKGKGGHSMDLEVKENLNKSVKVKVDLYQWLHFERPTRCELLINYARRPGLGNHKFGETFTEEDWLGNIEDVTCYQQSEDEATCTEVTNIIHLPANSRVKIVKFSDASNAIVETTDGQQLEVNTAKFVQRSPEWESAIDRLTKAGHVINYHRLRDTATAETPLLNYAEAIP